MRPPRWLAAPLVALVVVACTGPDDGSGDPAATGATPGGAASEPEPEPGPEPTSPPDATEADQDPDALLSFSGRQLDGGTFDGATVSGDVVVWFWTPW